MSIKGRNTLNIRLGLDPSGYNAGISKLEKTTDLFSKRVQKALGRVDLNKSFQGDASTLPSAKLDGMERISSQIEELKSIRDTVSEATNGIDLSTPLSEQIKDELKALEGLSKESERIREKILKASTKNGNSSMLNSLQRSFSAINKASVETAANLERLQSAAADIGTDNLEFASIEGLADLDYAIKVLESDYERLSEAQRNTGQSAKNASHPLLSLSQWLRSIGSHIPGIRKTSDGVSEIGRRAKTTHLDIGRMVSSLRRVALVSFAFRIAGAAMGRLRSIVSEYISDNAVLQAQVNGLKAGMGQALAPAINLVTNAMSALMPYILGVSNAIGQLMTMLFGSGWTAAADGANKTAAATGGAAKAQKELNRQLMSFDEINKLSASTDSSGGGGGSGTGTNITPIESKTPAWLERFKTSFSDLFNSEEFQAANIGEKVGMFVNTVSSELNRAVSEVDFVGIGVKVGTMFSDGITKIDWPTFGQMIGSFLVALPSTIVGFICGADWSLVGQSLSQALSGTFETVNAWMQTVDWLKIGDAVWQLLSNIDWSAIAKGFFTFLGGAIGAGIAILWPSLQNAAKGIGDYFSGKIQECGGDVVKGLYYGIKDGLKNIWDWIKENIFQPFVDGFKNAFGIHSPSTVMAEFGGYMMEGLKNGISDKFTGVMDKLADLKDRVFSIADNLKSAFSFEWQMPSLKLPHLSLSWEPVDNVVAKFFGVSAFPHLSVSWYAKGGILDGAQIFGRMGSTLLGGGERGREAVLPLEQNTDWMDTIAEKVVSLLSMESGGDVNATIYMTLDGDVLDRWVIKGLRRRARATGYGQSW